MNRCRSGFIQYDEFLDVIRGWGFDAADNLIRQLFDWLDHDGDNRISYEDLRQTAG
jgi:Ca2+-binding EF-hand superfamily protein